MSSTKPYETLLAGLIHDLRQPLGNIETSIFYLDLVMEHPTGRVGDRLRAMENQVAEATHLLHKATEELHRLALQRQSDEQPKSSAVAAG